MKIDRRPAYDWHTDTEVEETAPAKNTSPLVIICTLLIATVAATVFLWVLFVVLMNYAVSHAAG